MTVDRVLLFLAPLTPAVLPVVVFVWHRTRRELREIRKELVELRQAPLPLDPRLDGLIEAVDAIGAEVSRLTEVQRTTVRLLAERDTVRPRIEPGSSSQ
ncbi:MAG: hypothetical protein ACREL3_01765 [Gemmatimonadales bacterium]